MADLSWAGASDNGTLTTVDGATCLTGDGITANPALFSALVACIPGVVYDITAALSSPQGWPGVQLFAASLTVARPTSAATTLQASPFRPVVRRCP